MRIVYNYKIRNPFVATAFKAKYVGRVYFAS